MRIQNFTPVALRFDTFQKPSAPATAAARGYAVADGFDGPAAAASDPSARLEAQLEKALQPLMERLMAKLTELIARLTGGSSPAGAPQSPASPSPAPGSSGPGSLAPTPLNPDVPGQIAKCNTIKDPHVAPKSQFRAAVDNAIDKVRAQGLGVDPDDRDAITDYDKFHQAVVTELRRAGYNAAHDGEELAVGRPGDSFSEQFDISTSSGRVRHFYASWVSPPVWA